MIDDQKPTTVGELKLSDLPPIQELTISFPSEKLVQIGKVLSIVEVLVVVESMRSMPPLDLDTILFKSDGKPIGQIFDVFGSVREPLYSIRFSNEQQIKDKGIEKDMQVYFAPQPDTNVTKFAFINEIRKKYVGTDASWEHDNEPPENLRNNCSSSEDDDDDNNDDVENY